MAGLRSDRERVLVATSGPGFGRRLARVALVGVVILGIAAVVKFVIMAPSNQKNRLPVAIPESAPAGDPVPVKFAVKAGDVFVTEVHSNNHVVGTADAVDTKEGMEFDVRLTLGHVVKARERGPGLASEVHVYLRRADSHVNEFHDLVMVALGNPAYPYVATFDREPSGRPNRSTALTKGSGPLGRYALDMALSGLGDLATDWLPDHDVRLGEVWEIGDVSDVLPGLERIIRKIGQRTEKSVGFPAAKTRARLQAAGLEGHEGEACLRLHVALSMLIEGDVVPPAYPGWISTAAKVEGSIWLSVSTGIVWGMDLGFGVVTSYLNSSIPTEWRADGRIESATKRATELPD